MTIEKLIIQEYNLYDFAKAIEQGVLLGYEITDSNEDAPVQLGHVYYCSMVREELLIDEEDKSLVEIMDTLRPETERIVEALNAAVDIPVVEDDSETVVPTVGESKPPVVAPVKQAAKQTPKTPARRGGK